MPVIDPESMLSYQRPDEAVVVDQGGTSSVLNIHYETEELEGHRALLVGVRRPRQSHRHHRYHGSRHRKRDRKAESLATQQSEESETATSGYDTPSQRVQFILSTEEDAEHVAHELFTELDEICVRDGKDAGWKETARWLKFEEDVEDGGERWSKPYVATLSLHSLFELRRYINNGSVLLDMHADSIEEIADMMLDHQQASHELDDSVRVKVREALLKRHHHQNQKKKSLMHSISEGPRKCSEPHLTARSATSSQTPPATEYDNNQVDLSKVDMHFMKKIPEGAEACNVLVGELDFLVRPIVAFVRLSPAVLLTGLTEVPIPTRFLFILLGPDGKAQQYHEIGRSMATIMTDEIFHDVAYKAKDKNDLMAGIDEFLDQVTVLPPGEWDPSIRIEPPKIVPSQEKRKMPGVLNGTACQVEEELHAEHHGPELQRTGRLFGGLILDIKRKAPFYLSDFKDGLSLQCVASFLFLYCACMSPVITFGGLLGEATEGSISAMESLLGASITGIAYSVFAGQPLAILGSTGPVLVFEKILFKFCKDYDLSYLSLRTCIGLWTAVLCFVLVATDASSLVCYITRFTEEAFAALICLIFIYEALENLFQLGEVYPFNTHSDLDKLTLAFCKCAEPDNPSNKTLELWSKSNITASAVSWTNLTVKECMSLQGHFVGTACGHHGPYTPDVLFWSTILFFSTFFMSAFLKQFKTSRYFPTKVRSMISDFAVFLTIAVMVLLDYVIGVPSQKLKVPSKFQPTRDDRGWLINPIGRNPWWTVLAATIPALLCTILIFMDQQITAVIINRKEHKLLKGCGYHLDLLMVGLMLAVCSIMGLPWFVAATVLSISHVNSLKLESESSAPGEQPRFLGIREQRLTGLVIFLLMGCSVFMTGALQFIPMPVLYGVFLYMGVSSLKDIQFFDRLKLFCMPAKHQPDFIYLRHVPLRKVHLFTFTQLTCLVLLWVIRHSPAAIVFPMMVLALVFIRKLLDWCFSKRELSYLDDLMPEWKKKKLDDASKTKEEETYKLPHRLIEKKRRDRINECIAQLKDLLPEHLKLTTLGHLEKAVVLELTLKHVKALTSLLEQQQQKILALQNGMQIEQPTVSQEKSEEMFRSGFHMCAKEMLLYLGNHETDKDFTPSHVINHLHKVAAEVLQSPVRPRTPLSPPPEEIPTYHLQHQPHKEMPASLAPKPSEGYRRNCVPVIQRAYAPTSSEQSGSDTDTDSGYGGELEKAESGAPQGRPGYYGQESHLKRALDERQSSSIKREDEERRHKRPRVESSEDELLSGGESSSSSASSSSSGYGSYMSVSPNHPTAPHPLCMPFYLIPPSAAAYLPMLEKCWYPGAVPMLYPGMGGSAPAMSNERPQLVMSPRGGSPAPTISQSQTPMDSPALLQALKQVPPLNQETKD